VPASYPSEGESDVDLDEYHHPGTGSVVPVPPGWDRLEDPQSGVALIAREPDDPAGFRANLVLTVDDLSSGLGLDEWQADSDRLLREELRNYFLLDREVMRFGDRPVVRRLAHHASPDTGPVTMEQWAMVTGSTGYTLTASVATLSYDSLADVFSSIARRFRPGSTGHDDEETT
jgi:hypothetical protein